VGQQPVVYLISGPMAAGKTTVARLLASRFERGVHLEGDVFRRSIVSGRVEMTPDPSPEALGQLRLRYRLAAAAADTYCGAGFTVALEETVETILAQTPSLPSPIVVADYDETWPARFAEVAHPVRDAVADLGAEVEHVGSTSVPGLAAKPVIDVDVVVRSPDDVAVAIERLRSLGYVYQGDKGVGGREAFMWPPGSEPHHLYVVVAGSQPHSDHVRFRDYLRQHPDVANEYAALKRSLAEEHRDDRLGYTDAKSEFVAGVLRAAEAEDHGR